MMNGNPVSYTDQNLYSEQSHHPADNTNTQFKLSFCAFLYNFSRNNVRTYHQQIAAMTTKNKHTLIIRLADFKANDEHLYDRFVANPLEMLAVMEDGLKMYVSQKASEFPEVRSDASWQVIVQSDENSRKLREIGSQLINKLFVLNGIIISATKSYLKASKLKIKCRNCEQTQTISLGPGQNPFLPGYCNGGDTRGEKCPKDPFVALPSSETIDTQNMRIQENPEDIPVSQVPRTYHLIADRHNVGKCVPGDRVKITGIMLVNDLRTHDNLSKGQIYVTGIEKLKERTSLSYTSQEEQEFKKIAKDPRIYERIANSIAPGISGNQQIKKSIACMLFGGSRKHLPDNTILRGDINVLLIGDPSTAKSQFLKFVEKVASISVYTSGKGSSAAGLTASITKDPVTRQFQIEGGALVLADGGIVCIDEFDKMKPTDRVAIHEAMEQQTISVAKAGITTRLNSRCSILAAANPMYGCYDDLKMVTQQIEFQTTILSRFDCIFIVRDINTPENNNKIATHILNLHQGHVSKESTNEDFPFDQLKRYISYCRSKISPRLSQTACETLGGIYVNDRQAAKEVKKLTKNGIPITVRQLQAIIRLSESLAKMRMKTEVTSEDVHEAHHIFQVSTLASIKDKREIGGVVNPQENYEQIRKIEEAIRRRVCVGHEVTTKKLMEDLANSYNSQLVAMALGTLVRTGGFREIAQKKKIIREY